MWGGIAFGGPASRCSGSILIATHNRLWAIALTRRSVERRLHAVCQFELRKCLHKPLRVIQRAEVVCGRPARDRMRGTPSPGQMIKLALESVMYHDADLQCPHSTGRNGKLHADRIRAIIDLEVRFGTTDHSSSCTNPDAIRKCLVPHSFAPAQLLDHSPSRLGRMASLGPFADSPGLWARSVNLPFDHVSGAALTVGNLVCLTKLLSLRMHGFGPFGFRDGQLDAQVYARLAPNSLWKPVPVDPSMREPSVCHVVRL